MTWSRWHIHFFKSTIKLSAALPIWLWCLEGTYAYAEVKHGYATEDRYAGHVRVQVRQAYLGLDNNSQSSLQIESLDVTVLVVSDKKLKDSTMTNVTCSLA